MKTISFRVSDNKDASVILEVIKKFGFKPKIETASNSKNNNLRVVELAGRVKERKLSPEKIDKLIASERNAARK